MAKTPTTSGGALKKLPAGVQSPWKAPAKVGRPLTVAKVKRGK